MLACLAVVSGATYVQTSRGQAPRAAKSSPYDQLDVDRLGNKLGSLQMIELLEELVKLEGKAAGLLMEARIARAIGTTDQQKRDKLFDEVIAKQDSLLETLKTADKPADKMAYYRLMLRRISTAGDLKVDPYVRRIRYFHAKPGDAEAVRAATGTPLKLLKRLTSQMQNTHEQWGDMDTYLEAHVEGHYYRLGDLIKEAAYRGAWVRLNRGLVVAKGSEERRLLLRQAIEDVREFAGAADNSSGVKFRSLVLTGISRRLLGQYDQARSVLARAAHRRAAPLRQLEAKFETVVTWIDEGKYDQVDKAIEAFGKYGASMVAAGVIKQETMDFQTAMLKSRVLEVRAKVAAAKDPSAAEKLESQSLQVLLDLIAKYPKREVELTGLIAAKYEGKDPSGLKSPVLSTIARRDYNKAIAPGTPEAEKTRLLAKAEGHFEQILKDKTAKPSLHATALWYLGGINNQQKENRPAAMYFRQLASRHGNDRNALTAAENAVKSLEGVLDQRKKRVYQMDLPFQKEYADSLRILISLAKTTDPLINDYWYKYALVLKELKQFQHAINMFDRISQDSELYEPARFEILDLMVRDLIRSAAPPAEKQRKAVALVVDLQAYRDRAAKYTSDKPDRVKEVRTWGALCDLNVARVVKDIMNDAARASQHAARVVKRWPDVPEVKRGAQELLTRWHLDDGKVEAAIATLRELIRDDPEGVQSLVAGAMDMIRTKMEILQFQPGPEAAAGLKKFRDAYKEFAEKLFEWARANVKPEKMYEFRQALAVAYESGTNEQAAKALVIYEDLATQDKGDWINVRGLARCHRTLGNNDQAQKRYEELISNLPEKSDPWWRTHLERVQFYFGLYGDNGEMLERLRITIRRLRLSFSDDRMGEYVDQFGRLEKQIAQRIAELPKKE